MRALPLALALLGCGDGPAMFSIGATCADQTQCEARQTAACIATWPGGYCTEVDCSIGSCGDDAACAPGLMFPGVDITNFCLAKCEVLADCRSGYSCVAIAQAIKVCVPENPR